MQGRFNIGTALGSGTLLVDLLGARKALQFGLVDAVAKEGESLEPALARFSAPFLAQRPQVLRTFKALTLAAREPRAARKRLEIERMVETWTHPDHWTAAEGVLGPH